MYRCYLEDLKNNLPREFCNHQLNNSANIEIVKLHWYAQIHSLVPPNNDMQLNGWGGAWERGYKFLAIKYFRCESVSLQVLSPQNTLGQIPTILGYYIT